MWTPNSGSVGAYECSTNQLVKWHNNQARVWPNFPFRNIHIQSVFKFWMNINSTKSARRRGLVEVHFVWKHAENLFRWIGTVQASFCSSFQWSSLNDHTSWHVFIEPRLLFHEILVRLALDVKMLFSWFLVRIFNLNENILVTGKTEKSNSL
jgi:hypothetical protein